ncbi:hypothetical protein FDECE_5342 [Fusarium decemcellulare]|nr:hypothetical protein FDECE_5342 [Fusarium decemcellulare]
METQPLVDPTIPLPEYSLKLEDIQFDDQGDLWLSVGTRPSQDMRVDSRVLCRASPIFRKMLQGEWIERKPEHGVWKVVLPDDDSESFALAMDMAHGLFQRIKPEIAPQDLYSLCVVTNKYDMTNVLRPMERSWVLPHASQVGAGDANWVLALGEMMFVAWELGRRTNLEGMAHRLIKDCDVNEFGALVDCDSVPLEELEPFALLPVLGEHHPLPVLIQMS